jgi:pyruvate,water dikinase
VEKESKEIKCIYKIERALIHGTTSIEEAFNVVLKELPQGFSHPKELNVRIEYNEKKFTLRPFPETEWSLEANIVKLEEPIGTIKVFYQHKLSPEDLGPFLYSEQKLLNTIGKRLGYFVLQKELGELYGDEEVFRQSFEGKEENWRAVLDVIRKTEPNLFHRLLRKILHLLCLEEVEGADRLLNLSAIDSKLSASKTEDENKPSRKKVINNYNEYIEAILGLAAENIPQSILFDKIQKWIKQDRSSDLIKTLESQDTSLSEISDAIRKYYHIAPEKFEMSPAAVKGLRISLLRRFFTDQIDFINIAKEYIKITSFYSLINRMVFPQTSHGKLGGKSAGLFLAEKILERSSQAAGISLKVKTPKTWYIASDGILYFMHYNDLEDAYEQKYKEIEEVQLEYPQIVQVFKNSEFPPDMVKGLSMALDDFGDSPLIVRSSSLMEDQLGAAFSGKYKSLFLANQGSKSKRLADLLDAIAEVYASTFGPDPIEYRAEKGMLDFHEEMGIMIQEVVGTKVGKYYFPAFAGVAFSNNEFRWSPRIKRNDGLLRIVPGLGTRAVDRVGDDYPILAAPAQPNLRVNVTPQEIVRYSPKYADVINLGNNEFETIPIEKLLEEIGHNYPMFENVFSEISGAMVRPIMGLSAKINPHNLIPNFESLFSRTNFLNDINLILNTLQEKLHTPVDIEFAFDGKDFYLLQCRPQYYQEDEGPAEIPADFPKEKIIFTAEKFVSNGSVSDITHIVYVDPLKYAEISDFAKLKKIGRVVGKLNKLLPKRQFILMGPGRWGSRGDIKLGVSVTYSDISNTAMLIEIARKKGNYVPDLSFGTHFFQDLAESSIRYLPLYPDDKGIVFNEKFLTESSNELLTLIPEAEDLQEAVKVINIPAVTNGQVLKVLMNADLDKAMAVLTSKRGSFNLTVKGHKAVNKDDLKELVKEAKIKLTDVLDFDRFGINEIFLYEFINKLSSSPVRYRLLFVLRNLKSLDVLKSYIKGYLEGVNALISQASTYKITELVQTDYLSQNDFESIKNDIKLDYKEIV